MKINNVNPDICSASVFKIKIIHYDIKVFYYMSYTDLKRIDFDIQT